jgi:hypothetical protein
MRNWNKKVEHFLGAGLEDVEGMKMANERADKRLA